MKRNICSFVLLPILLLYIGLALTVDATKPTMYMWQLLFSYYCISSACTYLRQISVQLSVASSCVKNKETESCLHIYRQTTGSHDREDYGCSEFQPCAPKFPRQSLPIFSPKFCTFKKNFRQEDFAKKYKK